jgi:hypothetical protein
MAGRYLGVPVLTAHVSVDTIPCVAMVVTEVTVIAGGILHVLRLDVVSHIRRLGNESALAALPLASSQAGHHRVK